MTKRTDFAAKAFVGILIALLQAVPAAAFADSGEPMAESAKPPLQIVNQTQLKVVIQVNSTDTIPNGIAKQVLGAKNLFDQYQALGMKAGQDFEIVMVFRGDGAQFLLNDDAYDAKVKQPHPKGNPSRMMIEAMSKGGVKMFECAVAMRLKGYETADILPLSRVVVSGIGAIVDFEKSGYLSITP